MKHRIALTGGGTGGHVYPALAVAEILQADPDVEMLLYIGASGHLEERLAAERNLQFVGLKVSGLPRRLSGKLVSWPLEFAQAVWQSRKTLSLFKPTAILGTGGYASAAPLMAARMMSIPYAIHEPDAHPGLVNRLFASDAQLVSVGMAAAASILKCKSGNPVFNGNPVRQSFTQPLGRDAACAVLGLRPDLKTVLITGGSQGAAAINEALRFALPSLIDSANPIQIIHQVGEKNLDGYKQRLDFGLLHNPHYLLRPYFEDLSLAYAAADLAVCRSGAMTIAELSVTGTPALFIPFPYAAANHQLHNALALSAQGAAMILPQDKLTGQSLRDMLLQLLGDYSKLKSMGKSMQALGKPQAAQQLAEQVKNIGKD